MEPQNGSNPLCASGEKKMKKHAQFSACIQFSRI